MGTQSPTSLDRHPKCRSRLIVKNLPTYITEPRLREHFTSSAQPGELTDVRIVHKKDGSTRRIAFIGYKTEEQAQSARNYFDKTYLDVSKLRVETVTGTKDAPITVRDHKRTREHTDDDGIKERKRQKIGAASSRTDDTSTAEANEAKKQGKKSQLEEFQAVMGAKRNGRPSWAAEVDLVPTGWPKKSESAIAITIAANPSEKAKKRTSDKKKRSEEVDEEEEEEDQPDGMSDMEWMRRKMQGSSGTLGDEKVFEQSDEEAEEEKEDVKADVDVVEDAATLNPIHASILSNGRLFVRNLVFSCTEQELKQQFSMFGELEQVHIPVDGSSTPKGFAYIRFKQPADALTSYEALDGSSFQGRLLHILPAVDRNPKPADDRAGQRDKPTRLKDARAQKKKETSGKDFNWGVLYMNSDAVANSIADRLGISKSDIVNPDSSGVGGSAAVKLALAETHIISETKKYFEQRNVDLSLFSQPRAPRSKTIILVKNIPYGISAPEMTELFNAFGRVRRVLLPPAGTIAIVEFAEGQEKEASNAWMGLAYKRLKDSILYLEWAPQGLFDGTAPISDDAKANSATKSTPKNASNVVSGTTNGEDESDGDEEAAEDAGAAPGATLHIGNLSFATTSERLTSIFRHLPSFSFAKVATKIDPAKPGEVLSQGFGFVGFKDVEGAKKALKGIAAGTGTGSRGEGLVLDGHVLKVNFAGRGREEMEKEKGGSIGIGGKSGKGKGTKLIVKNLAFEVSRKELWELFSAHGQVKSVRLPNRADRRSRGFAFVDFATRKEAEHAMEQLKHSHLLGRHLVMEWAEKEQGVEEMRMKTAMQFGGGGELLGRKEKLKLGLGGLADGSDEE